MANTIKLSQNNFLRTNILTTANGKGRYLNKIIFFDDGGVIFENDGILQVQVQKENKHKNKYFIEYDFRDFELIEPIKKNKVDLSTKYNFYISSLDYMGRPSYDLYIYCNNNTDSPKVTRLDNTTREYKQGETHIYHNYLVENIKGYVFEHEKVTAETPETAPKFWIGQDQYTHKKVYYTSFVINKFERIERTAQAEKLRELEHILYKDYNIGIEKAQKIKELLQKYKKWLGGNK
jgi:hypothetical protein